jgi:hypothetical protein
MAAHNQTTFAGRRTHCHAALRVMTWARSRGDNAVMSDGIGEAELAEIEQRAARAFAVAPAPWVALLETRGGLGGESFIRLGDDPVLDNELYVTLDLGTKRVASPDVGLDAVIEYIAQACDAIPRLIAEIRRLRSL